MENTPTGPAPSPELAPQAPPTEPQLAPQQQAPATQPVAPNPELAALQAQLAEAQTARQLAEKQARDHQAAFTQTRQQLQAVVGAQPQADPMKPFLERYSEFEPTVAKALASRDYEQHMEIQSLRGMAQAQNAVPQILQQLYSDPKTAPLFSNATVVQDMQQGLMQAAQAGRFDLMTADYALRLGIQSDWYARNTTTTPPMQQQQTPPPIWNQGFNGPPMSGHQAPPPMQQQKQFTPAMQALKDDINATYFPKPKTA